MTTHQKRGKNNRSRGHSLERDVAKWFREHGFDAERILEYAQGKGHDVVAWKDKQTYLIQCKRKKAGFKTLYRLLKECNASPNETPLLVLRDDNERALIVMYLDDLNV